MKPPRKRMFGEVCIVWGLTCLALWQHFTLCLRPPEKSGFQVARCIAVYSNMFSYDMKAKWNTKKLFSTKNREVKYLGWFELFSWNFNISNQQCWSHEHKFSWILEKILYWEKKVFCLLIAQLTCPLALN